MTLTPDALAVLRVLADGRLRFIASIGVELGWEHASENEARLPCLRTAEAARVCYEAGLAVPVGDVLTWCITDAGRAALRERE